MPDRTITAATPDDAPEIAAIYAHYVRHGTATFESDPPDPATMRRRIAEVGGAGGPWLVARVAGDLAGYAYAGPFGRRAAYGLTCKDSVYVRHDHRRAGLGTALLAAVIEAATAAGFRQMIAVIAGNQPGSIALHARAGFAAAGRLRDVGRKHAIWIDTVYMQRPLGDGSAGAPPREPA